MKPLFFLFPLLLALGACSLLVDFEDDKTFRERDCDDNRDNDGDGRIDCDDQDCLEAENCGGPNANNYNNLNNVTNQEFCDNFEDDDGDGFIDCADSDCLGTISCQGREGCDNAQDDDGDGFVDCGDPDCFGPGCNVPGETDCGDLVDNDGDGMIDCDDPDCADGFICGLGLRRCNEVTLYETGISVVNYYLHIYEFGEGAGCPLDTHCALKPELSWVPFCYPDEDEFAMSWGACDAGQPCRPGLVCEWSEMVNPNTSVCLPLCAPGMHPACIGGRGVCARHLNQPWDEFFGGYVDLYVCDEPQCNPMVLDGTACGNSTQTCYPTQDMLGLAFCHESSGDGTQGTPCATDHECARGHVCRTSPGSTVQQCHPLCITNADCDSNITCVKPDNRQHFGFCK